MTHGPLHDPKPGLIVTLRLGIIGRLETFMAWSFKSCIFYRTKNSGLQVTSITADISFRHWSKNYFFSHVSNSRDSGKLEGNSFKLIRGSSINQEPYDLSGLLAKQASFVSEKSFFFFVELVEGQHCCPTLRPWLHLTFIWHNIECFCHTVEAKVVF